MFNVKKSKETPSSLINKKSYTEDDVHKQLEEDSYGKCYICGSILVDREVEHFVPKSLDKERFSYDWKNIFIACAYCNGKKSNTYNSKPEKEILHPLNDNIEKYIRHSASPFRGGGVFFKSLIPNNLKADNSIELLKEIYEAKESDSIAKKLKANKKKEVLIEEILKFTNIWNRYYEVYNKKNDPEYKERRNEVIRNISIYSPYSEFKIGIFLTQKETKNIIEQAMKEIEEEKTK